MNHVRSAAVPGGAALLGRSMRSNGIASIHRGPALPPARPQGKTAVSSPLRPSLHTLWCCRGLTASRAELDRFPLGEQLDLGIPHLGPEVRHVLGEEAVD